MNEEKAQIADGVASELNAELDRAATMNIIKCVVPISGGKDSQCCVKLALQKSLISQKFLVCFVILNLNTR